MTYTISPDLFFLLDKGKIVVWDYKNHAQFELEPKYFDNLIQASNSKTSLSGDIVEDLQAGGLVIKKPANEPSVASGKWGWDILSRIFHLGTKDIPCIEFADDPDEYFENYLTESAALVEKTPNFFYDKPGLLVDLPPPRLANLTPSLHQVLKSRKTCREFYGDAVSLQQLSDLLYAAFGLLPQQWDETQDTDIRIAAVRKTSPSSGGVHAEEAYVTVFRVDGLAPGLYYYRAQDHKLTLLQAGSFEQQVIDLNYKQHFSHGLAFGIYVTVRFDKYWWKYPHSRSYRLALLDIGHVSQTFLLSATALQMQTWMTGAFHDSAIERFLGIDGEHEAVMLYLGVGKGSNKAVPSKYLAVPGVGACD